VGVPLRSASPASPSGGSRTPRCDAGRAELALTRSAAAIWDRDRLHQPRMKRRAAQKFQRARVTGEPIRKLLRARCFRVRVVRCPEHGDEELDLHDLARLGIHGLRLLPRVVDQQLVTGEMRSGASTSAGRRATRGMARRTPCIGSRSDAAPVLQVQQLQRHARASHLQMHVRQIGKRTALAPTAAWPSIRSSSDIVELAHGCPVEVHKLRARHRRPDTAGADSQRSRSFSVAVPELVPQPQDLSRRRGLSDGARPPRRRPLFRFSTR
jgi:hypothetical protein